MLLMLLSSTASARSGRIGGDWRGGRDGARSSGGRVWRDACERSGLWEALRGRLRGDGGEDGAGGGELFLLRSGEESAVGPALALVGVLVAGLVEVGAAASEEPVLCF